MARKKKKSRKRGISVGIGSTVGMVAGGIQIASGLIGPAAVEAATKGNFAGAAQVAVGNMLRGQVLWGNVFQGVATAGGMQAMRVILNKAGFNPGVKVGPITVRAV